MDVSPRRVDAYDGNWIRLKDQQTYRLGNYLGGGLAGVVYEGQIEPDRGQQQYGTEAHPIAIKILNPIGYKLTSPYLLKRAEIIRRGVPITKQHVPNLTFANLYWVVLPNRTELIPCYLEVPFDTTDQDMDAESAHQETNSMIASYPPHRTMKCTTERGTPFEPTWPPTNGSTGTPACVSSATNITSSTSAGANKDRVNHIHDTSCSLLGSSLPTSACSSSGPAPTSFSSSASPPATASAFMGRRTATKATREASSSCLEKYGCLKELTLEMCVALWQFNETIDREKEDPLSEIYPENAVPDASRKERMYVQFPTNCREELRNQEDLEYAYGNEEKHRLFDQNVEETVTRGDRVYKIPVVPAKYKAFLQSRKAIFREIAHMHKLTGNTISGQDGTGHPNVLKLYDVLEYIQPSKSTIFLVLELADGGELFDRIKSNCGVDEKIAKGYLEQLLSGVLYCHQLGIVHRDLKPENLLLSEEDVLKIADFGFSAHYIAAMSSNELEMSHDTMQEQVDLKIPSHFRRLKSVVGSPHYVAPEVLLNGRYGYDGRKADMWSIGVVLYGLLAGSLPFGKELSVCPRFLKFSEWVRSLAVDKLTGKVIYDRSSFDPNQARMSTPVFKEHVPYYLCDASRKVQDSNSIQASRKSPKVAFPGWFFPSKLSPEAVFLLTCLLHPDPVKRYSCEDACRASWVVQ